MSKKPANEKQPANEIRITRPAEGKTDQEAVAEALVGMPIQAAMTVTTYLQAPFNACLSELMGELHRQVMAVNKGDMRSAEGLLITQAHTLNAIFHRLAQRAEAAEWMPHFEANLKLALRAQNQCRATLETLSAIKNPPNVAFVKQANIAHNQQVNNGTQAGSPATQPPAIDSTPQLEHTDGNYLDTRTETTAFGNHLDTRTETTASGNDSAMATVGEIYRPKDHQGQG